MTRTEEEETESDKDFVSTEAKDLWNRLLADKGFVSERGFGKLIFPFSEIIEKRGWECFCAHTAPEIHEFGWSYLSFCVLEMAKSTISGQNPHIGTSTESGYRCP